MINKNIKKIIAVQLGTLIISGNVLPAFAEEQAKKNEIDIIKTVQTGSKKIITLDDCINAAMDSSEDLALKSKKLSMYKKKENVQDKIDDFYESIGETVYDFSYDKIGILEDKTKQSKEFLKDKISNDITNKYNKIIIDQIDIEQDKINLEIEQNNLETLKTKVSLDMMTANNLTDKEIEISTLKNNIEVKENLLKNNIDYLQVLTNLDLSNCMFDSGMKYEKFKIDGSSDEYIDDKIDTYFKYDQQLIDLTKDYLDDLDDDGIDDILDEDIPSMPSQSSYINIDSETGEKSLNIKAYGIAMLGYEKKALHHYLELNKYSTYLEGKYGVDATQVRLNDTKKTLKNGLNQSYSILLDLENKIDDLSKTIESTNTKIAYAKTRMSLGMITENDYNKLIIKSKNLDVTLRTLVDTHNTLKNAIENPWILIG